MEELTKGLLNSGMDHLPKKITLYQNVIKLGDELSRKLWRGFFQEVCMVEAFSV